MKPDELLARIARLPKWALDYISTLEMRLKEALVTRDTAIAAVNGGISSSIYIARTDKPRMYLPDQEVTFVMDDGQEISVTFQRDPRKDKNEAKTGIIIRTNWNQMQILPNVSNTVVIQVLDRSH